MVHLLFLFKTIVPSISRSFLCVKTQGVFTTKGIDTGRKVFVRNAPVIELSVDGKEMGDKVVLIWSPDPNKDMPTAQFPLDERRATPATLTGVTGRPTLASAVGTKR
jgi:hypothetical protein